MLDWTTSEWADHGVATAHAGYTADVYPVPLEEVTDLGGWFWRVDATRAVSEWPEVWDCGFARSRDAAQRKAEAVLARF